MSAKLAHRLAVAAILAATVAAALAAYFVSRDIAEEERNDRLEIAREATLDALVAREDFLDDLSSLAIQPRAGDELRAFARIQAHEEAAVVSVQWVPRAAAEGPPGPSLLVPPDSGADRHLALTSRSPLADRIAERAIEGGGPAASPPLQLAAGDAAFYLALPAISRGSAAGAMVALVDGRRLLAAELPKGSPDVAVDDGGAEIATVGDEPDDAESTTVPVHGRTWTVSVDGASVGPVEAALPWGILLSGFVLALVVAVLLGRAVSRRDAALEIARRRESELEQRSREDELTRIYNRRHFTETLTAALGSGGRAGLAALLLDLDHFKAINDGHGHLTGDLVLQVAAQRLASVVRPTETLARWGGEEFAVLAEGLDRDGALALGERLRAAIADAPIEVQGEMIELSASVGVALTVAGDGDPDAIVGAADRALYEAKAAGRNRVVIAESRRSGRFEGAEA